MTMHGKSGLYLGDITHYARDGISCLKPFQVIKSVCWFWNNTNYTANAQTVWQDAFRYLEPEVQDAYFKIASNVANCPRSVRVFGKNILKIAKI